MKTCNVAVILLLGLGVAYSQSQPSGFIRQPFPTDNRPLSGEEWRLSLVAHLMSFPSPVTNGAMQLYGMGDEVGVDVLKILSAKSEPTSSELQSALDIIQMAFQYPESILDPMNKQPRATLFLLRYLAATTTDEGVSQRVTAEIASLQGLTVSSTPAGGASQAK